MRSFASFASVVVLFALCFAVSASAEVRTSTIEYSSGGVSMKGYLAWDDATKEKRPGILVVHEFWGLNEYAKKRTEQLAALGYVAFAADMYGGGRASTHPEDATAMMAEVKKEPAVWIARAEAALTVLRTHDLVDPKKVAAIGYCFGGTTVLRLAMHGAELAAVVTFHAGLIAPSQAEASRIKAKVLICHGAADHFTPDDEIVKLRSVFEAASVDYTMIYYSGAGHSFTVPGAGGMPGVAYDEKADKRSWQAMRDLFSEVF